MGWLNGRREEIGGRVNETGGWVDGWKGEQLDGNLQEDERVGWVGGWVGYLHVSLDDGVGEAAANQALGVKDGVGGVHRHLVLGGIPNQTLGFGEGDVGRGGAVALVVGCLVGEKVGGWVGRWDGRDAHPHGQDIHLPYKDNTDTKHPSTHPYAHPTPRHATHPLSSLSFTYQ